MSQSLLRYALNARSCYVGPQLKVSSNNNKEPIPINLENFLLFATGLQPASRTKEILTLEANLFALVLLLCCLIDPVIGLCQIMNIVVSHILLPREVQIVTVSSVTLYDTNWTRYEV